ncbi:hypothetical protein B4U37_02625 [Sutcliffiella horikoshii]|uniref:ACT domain-containing protein n=1 Tax=Sutcliffiella horikoshii TaxID=79883 RepID=A0A1Y0CJB2_9BACI|nr:hypothetical protein [Sutcliffiella horikoshii]ART75005.1 hypothetical protein B4U37_02625 [Sutcliffiella horikoshii]TYS58417.1 hypothetical protein FZC74_11435 [Sutcliffiella horikoshii]
MGNACLDFNIRTQFTSTVSDRDLSRILNGLAEESVNINGYFQTLTGKNFNFVRMVVGTSAEESELDIRKVRKVMKQVGVRYRENQVIQLLDSISGVPGQVNAIFGTLWCKMQVRAVYLGEDNNIFLDVSNIGYAIRLLSEEDPLRCLD